MQITRKKIYLTNLNLLEESTVMKIYKIYPYLYTISFLLFFGFCLDKSKPNTQGSEVVKKEEVPSKDYLSIRWVNFKLNQLKSDSTKDILQKQAKEFDKQGFALYKKKENKEAVTLYEKSIDSFPIGETYYNYGNSLSNIDRLEDSIKAYKIARYLNAPKPEFVLYNIACSYSRLNQVEMSYKYLTKAVDNGYKAFDYIKKDSDMENTRKDPGWNNRFKEIISPSRKPAKEEIVDKEDCEISGKVWNENSCKEKEITVLKLEKENFINSIGMEFVYITPGEFMMGCSGKIYNCTSGEPKQHKVNITKPFYMGKYEVTQGQWKKVMGNNPSIFSKCGDNCPVEKVSWEDVQMFIKRLNKIEGKRYRLPTEAEWEYAARAGSTTYQYWGNGKDEDYAWADLFKNDSPHPVGQKKPNAFGLYDMIGNVSEWTADWYDDKYDAKSEIDDPKGPDSGSGHTYRGCDWMSNLNFCSPSRKTALGVNRSARSIGFRLVLSYPFEEL